MTIKLEKLEAPSHSEMVKYPFEYKLVLPSEMISQGRIRLSYSEMEALWHAADTMIVDAYYTSDYQTAPKTLYWDCLVGYWQLDNVYIVDSTPIVTVGIAQFDQYARAKAVLLTLPQLIACRKMWHRIVQNVVRHNMECEA